MQNMNQLMRQAKKMQEDIMKAQEALAERVIEGTSGGGAVKVSLSGHKDLVGIVIDKEVVNPDDVEMLQDLIVAAFQDAMTKVNEITENEMGKYTRGLKMPGLF